MSNHHGDDAAQGKPDHPTLPQRRPGSCPRPSVTCGRHRGDRRGIPGALAASYSAVFIASARESRTLALPASSFTTDPSWSASRLVRRW